MASSGKAAPASLLEQLRQRLQDWGTAGGRLCLGYSGGLDSTVLLHLLAVLRQPLDLRLSAVHVHHGLNSGADRWQAHCESTCRDLAIPLRVERVAVAAAGQGVEAAARAARYAIYARQPADFVVLAQQRDDQAETLLLNLLRGSGPRGLAAMPRRRSLGPGAPDLLRPLLDVGRRELLAHAEAHGLAWVEDDSNLDVGLTRNRIRLDILSGLRRYFPACSTTLARAAEHLGDTAVLLDDLARLDLGPEVGPDALRREGIDLARLAGLSQARAANLLHYCLRHMGVGSVSAAALRELLSQLAHYQATPGHSRLCWWHAGCCLRVWRGRLWRVHPEPTAPLERLDWRGEAALDFAGGRLRLTQAPGQGLDLSRLAAAPVWFGARRGGERLRTLADRPRRALKSLLRESGLPPWERDRLPLLFCGEHLAWVAAIGVDAGYRCPPGQPGLVIDWDPSPLP